MPGFLCVRSAPAMPIARSAPSAVAPRAVAIASAASVLRHSSLVMRIVGAALQLVHVLYHHVGMAFGAEPVERARSRSALVHDALVGVVIAVISGVPVPVRMLDRYAGDLLRREENTV